MNAKNGRAGGVEVEQDSVEDLRQQIAILEARLDAMEVEGGGDADRDRKGRSGRGDEYDQQDAGPLAYTGIIADSDAEEPNLYTVMKRTEEGHEGELSMYGAEADWGKNLKRHPRLRKTTAEGGGDGVTDWVALDAYAHREDTNAPQFYSLEVMESDATFSAARQQVMGFSGDTGGTAVKSGHFLEYDNGWPTDEQGDDSWLMIVVRHRDGSVVKVKYIEPYDLVELLGEISRDNAIPFYPDGYAFEDSGTIAIGETSEGSGIYTAMFASMQLDSEGESPITEFSLENYLVGVRAGGMGPNAFIAQYYSGAAVVNPIVEQLQSEFDAMYWPMGGGAAACYGSAIGDSTAAKVIDLDGKQLEGSWSINTGSLECSSVIVGGDTVVTGQQSAPSPASESHSISGTDTVSQSAVEAALNALGAVANAIIDAQVAFGAFG